MAHRARYAGTLVVARRAIWKVLGAVFSNLPTVLIPIPNTGAEVFVWPARLCILLGVIVGIVLYFLYGRGSLRNKLFAKNGLLWTVVTIGVSAITYFGLAQQFDVPNKAILVIEVLSYCLMVFLISSLLAIGGASFAEWYFISQKDTDYRDDR